MCLVRTVVHPSVAVVLTLGFDHGTLTLAGAAAYLQKLPQSLVWDPRVARHRVPAYRYAELVRALHGQLPYADQAKAYQELCLTETAPLPLRPYQEQALAAWLAAKRRGVVVLPTGAGKTYVAVKAILACQRSSLVLVPTIDLVHQWADDLAQRLGTAIGRYGGGDKILAEVTVATYDSGLLFMPYHGNRFGLLICDECHHLPAALTSQAAESCLAPFRLGLTATPERLDGGHERLVDLLGPEVHRSAIGELEGHYLASYQAEVVEVAMDADEAVKYHESRQVYLSFVRMRGIDFGKPDGWTRFIAEAARDSHGREVMAAYREQRRLSRASRAKLRVLWDLLRQHAGERTIVFTDDNATAYAIGRGMLLPVLTHHTKPAERKKLLTAFRSGELGCLVTSRVLNEGVDVPEASLGIIVSGTGSVREHVQRLGRLLRPRAGKVAQLYELISAGTAEAYTSDRRRRHAAFGEEIEFGDPGP